MPVDSMLQMLCTLNFVLNQERLELKDIRIYAQEQAALISLREVTP